MVPDVLPDCITGGNPRAADFGKSWLAVFPCVPPNMRVKMLPSSSSGVHSCQDKTSIRVKRTGSPCHAVPCSWSHLILQINWKTSSNLKLSQVNMDNKKYRSKPSKTSQAIHGSTSTNSTRNQGSSKALTCFPPAGRRRSPSSSDSRDRIHEGHRLVGATLVMEYYIDQQEIIYI